MCPPQERPGRSTIRQVAQQAGVSIATVSNYFHHPEKMSGATRNRIGSAISDLQFIPSDAARTLRTGVNPVVGYVAFELASARTPAITNAIAARLAEQGMHLLAATDGGNASRERDYLALFERQQVAGIIVTPLGDVEPELARMRARGVPSVLCARRALGPEQPAVSIDHQMGGRLAAEHLLQAGCRKIGFVSDGSTVTPIADRFKGAQEVVTRTRGARIFKVTAPSRSVRGGEQCAPAISQLVRSGAIDAVLCVNDLVALGLCHQLGAAVDIPGDVAVMGYDDIEFARMGRTPLTSVHTPQEQLGTIAADLLLRQLGASPTAVDGAREAMQIELTPTLSPRASTQR